ncbi:MAG: PD-(D/E)XK nuclease family protein [Gammaproteobacteria bacterium]
MKGIRDTRPEVTRVPAPVPTAERGGTWLVPTQRLRRVLLSEEWAGQRAAGFRVAEMPNIFLPESFAAWHWERYDHVKPCMPPGGDHLFWMDAASDLDPGIDSKRARGLAALAAEAFALECAWEITDDDWGSEVSEDAGQYVALRKRFLSHLCETGFESRQSLFNHLVADIESGARGRVEGLLAFQGFDEVTPLELHLGRAWQAQGGEWREIPVEARTLERASVLAFPDREAELYAAAQFARKSLLENPSQRVGVIVLGLKRLRASVRAIFDDVLAPPRLTEQDGIDERPYNLSLGEPLRNYPLVEAALDILDRAGIARSPVGLSRLLRSPYWGDPTEDGPLRFACDCALRERGRNGDTGWDLPAPFEAGPENFRRIWSQSGARLVASQLDEAHPLSHWISLWSALLGDFGWPGARPLDSIEYQAHRAWNEVLEEIARLAALPRRWRFSDFRLFVTEALGERLFQPETPQSPIEIMGPLETAGLNFDRIWVVGAEAHTWPPEPHPHPFLPYALQRQRGLPHASSMREFQFNERLLARWQASTTEMVVSFTCREDDRDLDPSPLLTRWPAPEPGPIVRGGFRRQARGQDLPPDVVPFTEPVALGATEIRGGIRFLKDQAACPFQGFAEHRLRADVLPPWRLPFDPKVRGLFLHDMLERIWKTLRTYHPDLWDWEQVRVTIAQAVDASLDQDPAGGPLSQMLRKTLRPSFIEWIETWFLDHECRRQESFEIMTEQDATLTLAGLRFRCRADRIERLADGTLVIVDYKTGQPPPVKRWMGDRPLEPQLSVYALAWPSARALLVASLKPGWMGYAGVAAQADFLPGSGPIETIADWSIQQNHWRQALEHLAREIQAGRNDLDPHGDPDLPCDRCAYPALCRLQETRIAADTGIGEADSSHEARDASGTENT